LKLGRVSEEIRAKVAAGEMSPTEAIEAVLAAHKDYVSQTKTASPECEPDGKAAERPDNDPQRQRSERSN
jgi:hypothetical protein